MQHYSGNFTLVRTLYVPIEQAQIRDDVFLVVDGQNGIGWCGVGDIWIKRRLFRRRSREGYSRSASSTRSMVAAKSLATLRGRRWMEWHWSHIKSPLTMFSLPGRQGGCNAASNAD
jgi:hypothetical protein